MLASTGVHSNKRTQNYAFPAFPPSEWGIIFMYRPHFYDVWPRQIDFWQLRQTNLAMICSANGKCKINAERLRAHQLHNPVWAHSISPHPAHPCFLPFRRNKQKGRHRSEKSRRHLVTLSHFGGAFWQIS